MKRLIFVFVLSLIYFSASFSQLNDFFVCSEEVKNLYPSQKEITEKLHEEIERRTLPRGNTLKTFPKNIGMKPLQEDEIEDLRYIVFMKVFPDTISEQEQLFTELMKDQLLLWNNGYTHSWHLSNDPRKSFFYGTKGALSFKKNINKVSPDECIYIVYFIKREKYFYTYLAYKKNDEYIIVDKEGNEFDNLKVLIDKKYGSYKDYIELFKKPYP